MGLKRSLSSIGRFPDGVINVKQFGAKGDGIVDDTAAIQAALNDVPVNGAWVFLPPGTYKTTAALTVKPKTLLTGAGMFASIINNVGTGSTLKFNAGAEGTTIDHLGLIGQAGTLHGIELQNECRAFLIRRVRIESHGGSGIYLGGGYGGSIEQCHIKSNARYGVEKPAPSQTGQVEIRRNWIFYNTLGGILIDTGGQFSIMNNNIEASNDGTLQPNGLELISATDIVYGILVAGNNFERGSRAIYVHGPWVDTFRGLTGSAVTGNQFRSMTVAGVDVDQCDSVEFAGNFALGCAAGKALWLHGNCRNVNSNGDRWTGGGEANPNYTVTLGSLFHTERFGVLRNPVRFANIFVAAGASFTDLAVSMPDANYSVFALPNWPSIPSFANKAGNGVRINLSVVAPAGGGYVDVILVSKGLEG